MFFVLAKCGFKIVEKKTEWRLFGIWEKNDMLIYGRIKIFTLYQTQAVFFSSWIETFLALL